MVEQRERSTHQDNRELSCRATKVHVYEDVLREDYLETKEGEKPPSLVGAIDQGTSSTRFLVFTQKGRIAASAQAEHVQIYTEDANDGWHEHDPLELFDKTVECIRAVGDALLERVGLDLRVPRPDTHEPPLVAIGITNQRETTVAWNKVTGIPYYNAIVWDDARTQTVAAELAQGNQNRLRHKTGLPITAYFAGTKVKWLLDNVPTLCDDLSDPNEQDNVRFGTVDAWLMYQLTGHPVLDAAGEDCRNSNGIVCTDVSNASRWLFLDIHATQWDQALVDEICYPHELPISCLPQVCPSSHVFGTCSPDCGVDYIANVPISGCLGDQQAALFGQTAFAPGEAKNTYGTGLFLMMNTGTKAQDSQGLITTVAYQLGKDQPVIYGLEGSVSHSGSTIQWLRDQLQIIPSAPDSEALATVRNDGLYFVPAFAGLFAPHWRSDARACLVGLRPSHHKGHVCRAALEATAYQTKEVFDAIEKQASQAGLASKLESLKVDGGGTANELLMQFQCDLLNVPVIKPIVMETTALGVAFCAGLAVGVWKDLEEIKSLWGVSKVYTPSMSKEERHRNVKGWKKAMSRSLGWIGDDENISLDQLQQSLLAAEAEEALHEEGETVSTMSSSSTTPVRNLTKAAQVEPDSLAMVCQKKHPRRLVSAVLLSSALGLVVGAFLGTATKDQ